LRLSQALLKEGSSGFLTQPERCDVLWSARYPCRVSVSDRPPVLSLPGALAITLARAANGSGWRPAPSSPAIPGATTAVRAVRVCLRTAARRQHPEHACGIPTLKATRHQQGTVPVPHRYRQLGSEKTQPRGACFARMMLSSVRRAANAIQKPSPSRSQATDTPVLLLPTQSDRC
jgi:hypothetical protein